MTGCRHLSMIMDVRPSSTAGCTECLRISATWVHLRMCLTCGSVGCCDSSPNRHASKHARTVDHPLIRSMEPGEDWVWCYVDEVVLEAA